MKTVYRGEVYYADLSPVIGSEQGGDRPVLILQNDAGNLHSPTTIVAAITSRTTKRPLPTHVRIQGGGLSCESTVLLEQLRTIDKSRLTDYVGKISEEDLHRVDHAALTSLGMGEYAHV